MRYAVREKGSDAVVASSPEGGAEFTLSDGHLLKVRRAAAGANAEPALCLLPWLQQGSPGAQVTGNSHASSSALWEIATGGAAKCEQFSVLRKCLYAKASTSLWRMRAMVGWAVGCP